MDKKKRREAVQNIPEKKIELKKADKIQDLLKYFKEEYNVDVELSKNIKFKIEKVESFLKSKYEFRHNVINMDTEYKLKDEKNFQYLDDPDYREIWIDLKKNNISISDNDLKAIIYGKSLPELYHPFREYFNSIPKWDGKDYITEFLQQIQLKSEENQREYLIKGFKKWFVAMIVGLLEEEPHPFKVNQTCFVLIGGQSRFKTTFFESIIPKDYRLKYYYGSSFLPHNKDHEKYLAYKWIINFDEMAAMNKTDLETMKSKITQSQVVVRLPYAKADVHLKRRSSFTGTQNNTEFLRDDTGSRRWFVIEIDNITLYEDFDLDKMYAQGYEMYKEGFQYWFDRDDIILIEKQNEPHQLKSFEYELVEKNYSIPSEDEIKNNNAFIKYWSATDVAVDISGENKIINVNNTVIKNIGSALRKQGFKKICRRQNGKPVSLWCIKKVFEPGSSSIESREYEEGRDLI